MIDLDTPMYYSVAPCGCVKMMIVDTPHRAAMVAKEIADAVKAGETVHRSTVGEARSGAVKLGWCAVCRKPEPVALVHYADDAEARAKRDRARLSAWNSGEPIR